VRDDWISRERTVAACLPPPAEFTVFTRWTPAALIGLMSFLERISSQTITNFQLLTHGLTRDLVLIFKSLNHRSFLSNPDKSGDAMAIANWVPDGGGGTM